MNRFIRHTRDSRYAFRCFTAIRHHQMGWRPIGDIHFHSLSSDHRSDIGSIIYPHLHALARWTSAGRRLQRTAPRRRAWRPPSYLHLGGPRGRNSRGAHLGRCALHDPRWGAFLRPDALVLRGMAEWGNRAWWRQVSTKRALCL